MGKSFIWDGEKAVEQEEPTLVWDGKKAVPVKKKDGGTQSAFSGALETGGEDIEVPIKKDNITGLLGRVSQRRQTEEDVQLRNRWEQVMKPELKISQQDFDTDPVNAATRVILSKSPEVKRMDEANRKSLGFVQKPVEKQIADKQIPLEQKPEFTSKDAITAIKDVQNYYAENTNKSLAHLSNVSGIKSADNLYSDVFDEQIRNSLRPGNQTDQIAYKRLQEAKIAKRVISESIEQGKGLDEMAVDYISATNPEMKDLITQLKNVPTLGESMSGKMSVDRKPSDAFYQATTGRFLYEFLNSSAINQEAEKIPGMKTALMKEANHLIQKYPEFGRMYMGSLISQEMEDLGINNAILNVATRQERDKAVKSLVEKGIIGDREVAFYEKEIRPLTGLGLLRRKVMGNAVINTPGALENATEGAYTGFKNIAKGIYDLTGLREAVVGQQGATRQDLEAAMSQVGLKPKGIINEIAMTGGNVLGQSLSIGAGGRFLNNIKAANNINNAMGMVGGLQAYANYMPQARLKFPGDEMKQRAYATILSGIEWKTENIFNDQKVIDGILGKVKPGIAETIQDFTSKKITASAARAEVKSLIEKAMLDLPNAAKYFARGVARNDIEELSAELGDQVTTGVFEGKPFDEWINGERLVETARVATLGGGFIGALSANADLKKNRGLTAKNIYDMTDNADYWKGKISEMAMMDEQFASEAQDKIENLEYAQRVKADLDNTGMTERQKQKSLIIQLERYVKQKDQVSNTIQGLHSSAIEKLDAEQRDILDGKDDGTIEGDVSDELTPNETKAVKLAAKQGLPGMYGEIDPLDAIKEISYQAQGLTEDADGNIIPVEGGGRKQDLLDMGVSQEMIDAAIKAFPAPQVEETKLPDQSREIDMGSEDITQPVELSTNLPEGYQMPEKAEMQTEVNLPKNEPIQEAPETTQPKSSEEGIGVKETVNQEGARPKTKKEIEALPEKERDAAIDDLIFGEESEKSPDESLNPKEAEIISPIEKESTVEKVLGHIYDSNSKFKDLAEQILNNADAESLAVKVYVQYISDKRSRYKTSKDEVVMDDSDANNATVLIHEIIHAATSKKIPTNLKNPSYGASYGKAYYKELKSYLDNIKGDKDVKNLIRLYLKAANELGFSKQLFEGDKTIIEEKHNLFESEDGKRFGIHLQYESEAKKLKNYIKDIVGEDNIKIYTAGRGFGWQMSISGEGADRLRRSKIYSEEERQYTYPVDKKYIDKRIIYSRELSSKATAGNADLTFKKGAPYGLGNLDEFLAEAFSSKSFQEKLASIKDDSGVSLWQKFVDAIKKLIGIGTEGTLLNSVIKTGANIISKKRNAQVERFEDIQSPVNLESAKERMRKAGYTDTEIKKEFEKRGLLFEEGGGAIPPEPPKETVKSSIFVERPATQFSFKGLQDTANEFGYQDVKSRETVSDVQERQNAINTVNEWVEKGEYQKNISDLLNKIYQRELVPTAKQRLILEQYLANKKQELRDTPENSPEFQKKINEVARIKDIGEIARQEAGAALRIPTGGSVPHPIADYADALIGMQQANGVDFLTEKQKQEVRELVADYEKKDKEAKEKLSLMESRLMELEAAKAVGKLKEFKRNARKKTAEQLQKERADILNSLKEKWKNASKDNTLSSDIPYRKQIAAIVPDVKRLVSNLIDTGVNELGQIIDNIYSLLKENGFDEIEKNDVRDIIAGKYSEKKTRSQLAKEVQRLKTEANVISELETLLNSAEPKDEKGKIQRNRKIADLRKRINEVSGEQGEVLKQADEYIAAELEKKRAQEEINQLEKELKAEVNKAKKETLDAKIKEAKETKRQLDYKSPGQKRLEQIRQRNEAEAQKLRDKIEKGDFEKEDKPVSVFDSKDLKQSFPKEYKEMLDAIEKREEAKRDYDIAQRKAELAQRSKIRKTIDFGRAIIATSKAVKAGIDDSAIMMQNIVAMISHPRSAAKALREHALDALSEKRFRRYLTELHNSPIWDLMKKSGLDITDPQSLKEQNKEEIFDNNLLNKDIVIKGKRFNIGKYTTKPFERAFTSLGNAMRVNMFTRITERMMEEGKTFETHPQEFKDLATVLNTQTGRGKLHTQIQRASELVTAGIWSPRLMASRLNMLGASDILLPLVGGKGFYAGLSKDARNMAIKDMVKFIGAGVAFMAWAGYMGADVDDDPYSPTFGSVKVGNKKYNTWGGFSQYVKMFVQGATGKRRINGKMEDAPRTKVFANFLRSRLTPATGTLVNILSGKDFKGKPITFGGELENSILPLSVKSVIDGIEKDGTIGILTEGLPSFVGIGVSDERDFEKKEEPQKRKTRKERIRERRERRNNNN